MVAAHMKRVGFQPQAESGYGDRPDLLDRAESLANHCLERIPIVAEDHGIAARAAWVVVVGKRQVLTPKPIVGLVRQGTGETLVEQAVGQQ